MDRRPPRLQRLQERVLALAQGRYAGFNHSHLTEGWPVREGIDLSRSTVGESCWRVGSAAPAPSARRRYLRRARYPQEGMLRQIDGSRHGCWRVGGHA